MPTESPLPLYRENDDHWNRAVLNALRYYWITAKGFRLRPWKSPYIRWRLETFFGAEAAHLTAVQFFRLLWRERARLERFLDWVTESRARQASRT